MGKREALLIHEFYNKIEAHTKIGFNEMEEHKGIKIMNKTANDLSLSCGDCEFLSITEKSQDNMRELGRMSIPNHYCMKYNKRVYHISHSDFGLARLNVCIDAEKEGLMPEKNLLEKKDINVFRGKIKAGEKISTDDIKCILTHIEILEGLLDQTDDEDFMGFDFGNWRESV